MLNDAFPPCRTIRPGSRLAIVAPAGPFDREAFQEGVKWLRTRYEIVFDESIFSRQGFLAGDDDRRLAELENALSDPGVDGILCARGGYGVTRLLPRLGPDTVAAAAKPVVGFSDITALHALWARAGVRSFHAEMVANLGRAEEPVREAWAAALEEGAPRTPWPVVELAAGEATGRLTGGNLAVLVALLGTPFVPPLDGAILFLEDVGERPYRIDRMLTQLTQAGWFSRCAGVVLGAFTEGEPGPDGTCLDDVLSERLGNLGIPVACGVPSGHISGNATLPFGACARIESGRLRILPD